VCVGKRGGVGVACVQDCRGMHFSVRVSLTTEPHPHTAVMPVKHETCRNSSSISISTIQSSVGQHVEDVSRRNSI